MFELATTFITLVETQRAESVVGSYAASSVIRCFGLTRSSVCVTEFNLQAECASVSEKTRNSLVSVSVVCFDVTISIISLRDTFLFYSQKETSS